MKEERSLTAYTLEYKIHYYNKTKQSKKRKKKRKKEGEIKEEKMMKMKKIREQLFQR